MNGCTQVMNRVIFISQKQAEQMRPPLGCGLVSITDSNRPLASLSTGWQCVLRLEFDDVDPVSYPGANGELTCMSKRQAEVIAEFFMENHASVKRFVVHCRAGISRSAGVAKAICQAVGLPFPEAYGEYNRHVHALVRCALAETQGPPSPRMTSSDPRMQRT